MEDEASDEAGEHIRSVLVDENGETGTPDILGKAIPPIIARPIDVGEQQPATGPQHAPPLAERGAPGRHRWC